jgi:steroid delta-isomerase-like uncharacterized protein
MARATRDAEGTVRAYVDVWNERDYSKIPEVVSESISVYNPTAPGGEVHGRDGLEAFMRGVVAGFPDFHVTVHDVVSNDDLVMYDATLTMTHEGEFDGIPPTGREVEVPEMAKYHVVDDKVREYRVCFDQQAVFEQLGLTDE